MPKILDAYAVLFWMEKDEGYEKVHQLLQDASVGTESIFFSSLSATEVYFHLLKHTGEEQTRIFFEDLKKRVIPIEIVPLTNKRAWNCAKLMKQHPIPLPNAFTASLAIEFKAGIVTGDHQFKGLEEKGIVEVEWLREESSS